MLTGCLITLGLHTKIGEVFEVLGVYLVVPMYSELSIILYAINLTIRGELTIEENKRKPIFCDIFKDPIVNTLQILTCHSESAGKSVAQVVLLYPLQ